MKPQVNTTQKKTKANNQQKIKKKSYANRIHGYKMTINITKKT